jgi:hypothetical protein
MKRRLSHYCAFCESKEPVRFVAGIGLCQRHNDLVQAIQRHAETHPCRPLRRVRKPIVRRSPAAAEASA